jgi:23S rRNA (uracil1939-C5)-methyltransferase
VSRALPGVGDVLSALVIDGIDDEGRGRAVVGDGAAAVDVAVRGALPGDVVDARVERVWDARRLAQARRLSTVDDDAPHAPRTCAHRGPCPACPLHGVDDGFVLAFKRARVAQAFVDVGLVVDVAPTIAGSGVRQKVKLVAGGAPGRLVLGHYVPHSHVVVDATGCGHAPDAIADVVLALRDRLDGHRIGPDVVAAVIARQFAEGIAVVVVAHGPPPVALAALCPPGARGLVWRVPSRGQSDNAIVGGDVTATFGDVTGTPLDARAGDPPVDVDTFCQADPASAQLLVKEAAAFVTVGPGDGSFVADLYAGTGAFARALVHAGHRVVAVESFPASALALARLPGVEAIPARVEDAIALLAERAPHAAIVDPPKKGLGDDVALALAGLPLQRLALVSCDVDAGARDTRALVDAGFVVDAVVPVDLFPGSAEVEVLTLLRRA